MKHPNNQSTDFNRAEAAPGSFRSVFKWGRPEKWKDPGKGRFIKTY